MSDEPDENLDSNSNDELLGFYQEDRHFLLELQNIVQFLISRETTTAEQTYHLAKLLFALERFPRPTKGIELKLSLGQRYENEESDYLVLHLNATSFQLGIERWIVLNPAMGGDSMSETDFEVEIGNYREISQPTALMDWVGDFRRRAGEADQELRIFDFEDASSIDWEAESDETDWDKLRTDYP